MSYMLPHLHNGWQVDQVCLLKVMQIRNIYTDGPIIQAILAEEDRVVVIRFGHDWDPSCMRMDEVFYLFIVPTGTYCTDILEIGIHYLP
jgi:U5 snRNP protein, DIM1 family